MNSFSIFLLFFFLARASGHGLISWPRQRGLLSDNNYGLKVLNPKAETDHCPHCLNGGGAGSVKQNTPDGKWTPYEPTDPSFRFRDDHGLCGDPKQNNEHMFGGKYYTGMTIATYEQGDYIDMESHVSAHHNGYFEFFACNLDCCNSNDLSKACFTQGCCKKLLRVPHKSCESGNDRECGPIDPRYPGRWYLPPRDQSQPENNWYGGKNQKMRYSLPKDMVCDKCVVHWAWVTANTCNPPGYADYKFPTKWNGIPGDGGSIGGINRVFGTCGDAETGFPEEFWSCSENIRITRKNGGKNRSVQAFHDGETKTQGPNGGAAFPSTMVDPAKKPMKQPMKKPVKQPVAMPVMMPVKEPVVVPTPHVISKPTPTPTPKTVSTENAFKADDFRINEENIESSTGELPRTGGSSYNLTQYISSYDSGICVSMKGYRYCEACLDLGYGVSKCFWCAKYEQGGETCLHKKP